MIPGGVVLVELHGQRVAVEPDGAPYLTIVRLDGRWTVLHRDATTDDAHFHVGLAVEQFGRANVEPVTLASAVVGGYVHGIHAVSSSAISRQPSVDRKRRQEGSEL